MVVFMAAKKRTLSVSEELDSKLVELCEALSISPNNYINNVVAKAVLNDRTALVSQQKTNDVMSQMAATFAQMMSDADNQEKLVSEK